MQLLIKNVRTSEHNEPIDIAIDGGRIAAIERGIGAAAQRIVDAGGRAAIPGLLEPHLHLEKALLHRRMPARSGTLEEAIRITGILKGKQEREDVLARSRQVLDMAVKAGTTAIRAQPDVDVIQGLIGVETALELREEYRNLLDLQIVAFPQEGILKSPGTVELMERALRLGADVVGGCPYNELTRVDTEKHIDIVFGLAQKYGVPVDLHADFADDASDSRFAVASFVARKTIETGYRGRVSLGHMTSLGALTAEEAKPVIDLLHEADIHIVTLPATDVYLGGRKDERNQRRGLTPVRRLRDGGVNVTFASNNIRNAFTPFGKADPLLIGNFLAHLAQFGTPENQAFVLDMGTYGAARAMGIADDYGIKVGRQADLVILDTFDVADALLDIPARSWVVKRGRVTVETHHSCEIHRY
ncbi:MAG TPA: amidohydrolase family protein [Stellaceae bacterium]|nr:amidohydrolase family protein [Stellaceae bacterium]